VAYYVIKINIIKENKESNWEGRILVEVCEFSRTDFSDDIINDVSSQIAYNNYRWKSITSTYTLLREKLFSPITSIDSASTRTPTNVILALFSWSLWQYHRVRHQTRWYQRS